MICRPLAGLQEITCASPTYLARYGTPHTIEGLTGHVMIGFVSSRTLSFTQNGRQSEVSLPCRLLTSDADVGAEAARRLWPVSGPLPRLEADLASGALTEVLADFRPAPLPLSLLYPSNRQLCPGTGIYRLGDGADEASSGAAGIRKAKITFAIIHGTCVNR